MEKEKLTLKQKFEKYNGRIFTTRTHKTVKNNAAYCKYKIVGYNKKSNMMLIGKLKGHMGITAQFFEPNRSDVIHNHERGDNYIYISLDRIEKYPEVKKVVSRISRVDEIKLQDVVF